MIRLSLSELKFAVRWAAKGVRAPPGLAEDFAGAARYVALMGINPLPSVTAALAAFPADYTWGRLRRQSGMDFVALSSEQPAGPVIEMGPAFAETVLLNPGYQVQLSPLVSPVLLAGYLNQASYRGAGRLNWQSEYGEICFCYGRQGLQSVLSGGPEAFESKEPYSAAFRYDLPCCDDGVRDRAVLDAAEAEAIDNGIEVTNEEWAEMWALTSMAWVKSSETSRLSGAGAGVVDRD